MSSESFKGHDIGLNSSTSGQQAGAARMACLTSE
jgi:hypothetical protein